MNLANLSKAAAYPFSSHARALAREKAYSLEDIPSEVIEAAERLILETVQGKGFPRLANTRHSLVLEQQALAFPVAKIILSLLADPGTSKRFSEQYSQAVFKSIEQERFEEEEDLARDLGIKLCWEDKPFAASVKVLDYISVDFGRDSQELVNQAISSGRVLLTRGELDSFLARKAFTVFHDSLALLEQEHKNMPQRLKQAARELKQSLKREVKEFKGFRKGRRVEAFPPCVTVLYSSLLEGGKLSHLGNFALATFLASLAYSRQEMLSMFKKAPNYNHAIALYQVNRILGKGPEPAYSAPSCEKMKEYGLCVNKDSLCDKINHPVSYYFARTARKKGGKQ